MAKTVTQHVMDQAHDIIDELKAFMTSKMAHPGRDNQQLQSLLNALRPVENLVSGIEPHDISLPRAECIATVSDAVNALLLLAEKDWLFPLNDDPQLALANKGLSDVEIDAVRGIVYQIREIDFSDSEYEDVFDLAALAADPQGELNALIAEHTAWQAEQGLESMCALEQIHTLEPADPRQSYLHEYCERREAAVRREPRVCEA